MVFQQTLTLAGYHFFPTDKTGSIEKGVDMGSANGTKSGSVMVVGAGIAGMQSALDLAESGYYVYLVEKSSAIGGLMSQLDKTFPTNDCAM
jgi:heterodisulfide reductase subunit A-like polyferredoxin